MTKARIALTDLAEKGVDVGLVRDMLQFAAVKSPGCCKFTSVVTQGHAAFGAAF
jgi:hypothetical protein